MSGAVQEGLDERVTVELRGEGGRKEVFYATETSVDGEVLLLVTYAKHPNGLRGPWLRTVGIPLSGIVMYEVTSAGAQP